MAIRQGVFRIGEVAEISGYFLDGDGTPLNVTGVTLTIKKPDKSLIEIPMIASNGFISLDVACDMAGTWFARLECDEPTPAVHELKFEVVASTVLPA